jgi:hypothetical protein
LDRWRWRSRRGCDGRVVTPSRLQHSVFRSSALVTSNVSSLNFYFYLLLKGMPVSLGSSRILESLPKESMTLLKFNNEP